MSDILKISDVKKAIELLNTKGVTGEKVLILQGDTFENALTTYARMCVEAEKKSAGWVKTADRLPQDDELPEEDNGMVMCAFLVTGVTAKPFYVFELTRANAIRSYPERTAYWMPIPKLPEVEE